MNLKKGMRVKVDFVSESGTIYSGKRFTGNGVVDRVEDNRVFGRLDDGTPFMCFATDVSAIQNTACFKTWLESTPEYPILVFQYGDQLFSKHNGEYRILAVRFAHRLFRGNA